MSSLCTWKSTSFRLLGRPSLSVTILYFELYVNMIHSIRVQAGLGIRVFSSQASALDLMVHVCIAYQPINRELTRQPERIRKP